MNGLEFKLLRTYMGLTQDKIAEICRVTQPTVQRWEKGTHPVPFSAEDLLLYRFQRWNEWLESCMNLPSKNLQGVDTFRLAESEEDFKIGDRREFDLSVGEQHALVREVYVRALSRGVKAEVKWANEE